MADLSVNVGGVRLSNPVVAASGTFGFGREYERLVDVDRLGGICTKGITLAPRDGNPAPRLWETASGLLNSIGLQNPGIDAFLRDMLPQMKTRGWTTIVNIWGEDPTEYGILGQRLADSGVDALEVNVSCPNVPGTRLGEREDTVREVVTAVRRNWQGPIWVKLPPDAGVAVARAAIEAGGDAIVASNTFRGMAIDIDRGAPVFGALDVPVIGCGGIRDWREALEFFFAGGAAIEVGTAHYIDPRCGVGIVDGLKQYMESTGLGWKEIRGKALGHA